MRTCIRSVVMLLLFATSAYAQDTLTGKVFDKATKEPLPGAIIFIHGSQTGGVTSANGSFSIISAIPVDSITISLLGYKTVCMKGHTGKPIFIALESSAQNLQAITVTASRDEQERKDIPGTINIISPQVIRETNPTQMNQLLNKIPGLVMKDLNNEQHMMSIRQPMTSRPYFLYLEDGIPIAPVGNFNHNQLIEVNMLSIRTIEVVKGPASSIYGSNAVGGAINFITQSPTALPTAKVGYQQNNFGYQRLELFAGSYLTPKLGLSIGGYMAKQRDSWQSYSNFDKISLSAKAIYNFNNKTSLTAYITSNSLYTQTGGSIDSIGFYSRKYPANNNFCYRKVDALRGRLTLSRYWNENSKTNVTLYSGQSAIGQNPRYRIKNINKYSAKGEENKDSYINYGVLIQHAQSFRFLQSKLTGGVTANYAPTKYWSNYGDILRDTVTGYYTGYISPDSSLANYETILAGMGGYLQFEFNPGKRLKVVLGLRYDQLAYKYNNLLTSQAYSGVPDTTVSNSALSPKAGFTFDLGHNTGLYANFSRGFAPPQSSDLFFGTKIPVLKPAHFNNYEAGAWTALLKEKLYLDVCVYRLEGINEIVSFRLPDNSTENRNSGKTLHQGIEYSLTYRPVEDILFRIGGTNAIHKYIEYDVQERANGEIISYSGNYMTEAPSFISNAELTLKPRFIKGFRIALEWQGIGPWYKNDANTFKYEDKTFLFKGASILNLRTAYQFKNVEVYCNILNLTDELYANGVTRNAGNKDTFAAGAPRIVAFGLTYHFQAKEE
ncbi:MAG: TonB-dependent receptor [Bacteroidota bacterium]|nr:TonB-dependent receptor [Bacteroidota bacterium]